MGDKLGGRSRTAGKQMNTNDRQKYSGPSSGTPEPSVRPGIRLAVIGLLAAVVLAIGVAYFKRPPATGVDSAPSADADESARTAVTLPPRARESTVVALA